MRDKVYIVWLENFTGRVEEDELIAVCASAKDAEEYIEEWTWARVQSRVAASEESLKVMQDEEQERLKSCLYITDHKVLGSGER